VIRSELRRRPWECCGKATLVQFASDSDDKHRYALYREPKLAADAFKAGQSWFFSKDAKIVLPFIGEKVRYTVPKGWGHADAGGVSRECEMEFGGRKVRVAPSAGRTFGRVIDDLVRVCVSEHRDNKNPPECVGNRESSYRQC
jgi:hypothetical protein